MFHLSENGEKNRYVVYEPEDFSDPVVGYTAIQYWMSEVGEDFFDYYGHRFHFSNFVRFLYKRKEVSKELLTEAVFDDFCGEHQDIAHVIECAIKDDKIADDLSTLITDKIYQLFAIYVSERAYTKLYEVITNGGALFTPFLLVIKEDDINYWKAEYDYLTKINLMEELANEDEYKEKGIQKIYPDIVHNNNVSIVKEEENEE